MNDPAICDLAQKTIDVLNKDGWSQGNYTDDLGSHCLVGAIWEAAYKNNLPFGTSYWLMGKMAPIIFDESVSHQDAKLELIRWNDSDKRTKEDVINLLQKVCA